MVTSCRGPSGGCGGDAEARRFAAQADPGRFEECFLVGPGLDPADESVSSGRHRVALCWVQCVVVEPVPEALRVLLDVNTDTVRIAGNGSDHQSAGGRGRGGVVREARAPVRGSAAVAGAIDAERRSLGERTALHSATQESERESTGERPASVWFCPLGAGSCTVNGVDERGCADPARPSEEPISCVEDVVHGGQEEVDHRLLIRRYCTTAMGAKTAMIARQHSAA